MRKLFINFVLLAAALLVGTNAWAYTGTGTESDPYLVSTASDLSNLVRYNGGHIKLISDITYSNYMQVGEPTTLDLDIYTITFEKINSYGFYVYANFTINASFNDKTGHYGSIYNTALGVGASFSTIYVDDASATVTINSGYIRSNGAPAITVNNGSYGAGNLVLGTHASVESDNNVNDISASATSITFNGNFDDLHVSIGKNNTKINNTGSLTNVRWLDTKLNCVYNNTGTMTFAEESSIRQTTFDTYFTDANLAQGRYKEVNGNNYDIKRVVAKVGDVNYNDLKTALRNSSEDSPAVLQASISLSNSIEIFDFPDVPCLDLNGNTITSSTNYVFSIRTQGLIVEDNSAEHTGSINHTGSSCIFNADNLVDPSILHIKGGTFNTTATGTSGGAIILSSVNPTSSIIATIEGEHTTINCSNGGFGIGMFSNVEVNVKGGVINTANNFCIANNGSDVVASYLNISGGTMTSTQGCAIYWPGSGTVNISGENTVISGAETAVEIRAGELNINGGSLTSTYDGFVCDRNGNGITTKGAALAIAQHTTKQPITVNISGGHFKGNYPISQCNPQENEAEYVALLNIEVTGGYFWADNGTSIISHTEDRRLFLKGGVYNLDPAAFTVNGYFSLTNQPELYAGSYAQGYVYKVAQQNITETETKGTETTDWAQNTTWTTDLVPDYATNVTISKDIVVTTSAEANTVTINTGSTLTVKDGGTLIIGNGGIVGATEQTFIVENGGQVLIAPNAENATLRGSVDLLADRAGLKPGVSYTGQGSEMYWQHIAIPTQGAPESITPSVPSKTFFNTWDIMKGWQNVGKDALNTPFKGYNLGNFHPYSADGSASVVYTFVGQLVGNQPDYMVFAREGHSFFGNSYLAPLDVATMFGTLYNPELEYTLNIYDSQTEMYQPVNKGTYALLGITEIKPLQGFFIYAQNATQAQLDYNSAVYTAYLNKHAVGGQTAAPARKVAKTNTYDKMAQITIAATTGEKDAIYLFEDANFSDAEDNGFDARNLEHSGLDMSIVGSYADLSVLATDNLEGAVLNINTNNAVEYTMTFSHIQGNMTLTDNVTGAVIAMEEGATYTFAAQPNAQLNGRFAINAVRTMPTNNERITINPAAKGVYTMMGQYVGETANWHALPAGVYVVDGVRVSK